MSNPKFKIGDLFVLHKSCSFLERKWFYGQDALNKTIRTYDYIRYKEKTYGIILNNDPYIYDVLLFTEKLPPRSLVIFVSLFEPCASKLT